MTRDRRKCIAGRVPHEGSAQSARTCFCPLETTVKDLRERWRERAVPFRQVGCVPCIEVVGIPTLKCQVCNVQTYDLTLLARIESILCKRVEQGVLQTRYTYEQLAAELTTDVQPS